MTGKLNTTGKSLITVVLLLSTVGIISYFWYGMVLGPIDHKILVRCFLSIMMYISTIKYIVDYYCRGDESVRIYGLLLRYSIAMAGTLMSVHRDSYMTFEHTDTLFVLIVVVLMLIPYVTGNLSHTKHNVPLIIVIDVLITAIAVLKLSTLNVPEPLLAYGKWGTFAECFNEVSQTVQWYGFSVIYLLRWQEYKKGGMIDNSTEAQQF